MGHLYYCDIKIMESKNCNQQPFSLKKNIPQLLHDPTVSTYPNVGLPLACTTFGLGFNTCYAKVHLFYNPGDPLSIQQGVLLGQLICTLLASFLLLFSNFSESLWFLTSGIVFQHKRMSDERV